MRLSVAQIPDLDQIEQMRPKKGDLVTHGEDLFVVAEIGMRYLVCHSPNNPKMQRWFKYHEVWRVPPEEQPGRVTMDLAQIFPGIGPRD